MFEKILNNPHYIMYAMIVVFVIVVIGLIVVASANARKPSSDTAYPISRHSQTDTRSGKYDGSSQSGTSQNAPSDDSEPKQQ